jgi:hypothetical protein
MPSARKAERGSSRARTRNITGLARAPAVRGVPAVIPASLGATGRRCVARVTVGITTLLVSAVPAVALVVGGGGSARVDCLAVFTAAANVPAGRPQHIRCVDGDPCDADGVVNGRCEFPIAVCANSTADPRCTVAGVQSIVVEHARDDGDPRFDPEFLALQSRIANDLEPPTDAGDRCSAATNFHVAVAGPFAGGRCKSGRKLLRVLALSRPIAGKIVKDADQIKLTCEPAPAGCTPRALFTGTFDRVQRQIFDRSCAVSGCHDSQSQTGNLLLESGAAHGNLVGVAPSNPAANAAGWKRVTVLDATTGDLATSLLVAKLVGPPSGYGARMPFGGAQLEQSLIDLVQLWIAAGAPETGWVPGTD